MQKSMQNTFENHKQNNQKYIQNSIPEGSGGLLRASWAPGASQNCFQSPPGPQKNSMIAPGGAPECLWSHFSSKKNLAIMEREARETEECQAWQARREQREQEEQQERERQNHIEEQGESGESRARIETASPYDRLFPSSPAARARRAV